MLLYGSKLFAHGWDYYQSEESGDVNLSESFISTKLIITSFIFLVLFLIRINIKKIEYKKAKLISNLMLLSYLIYINFISECSVLDVMIMALGLFFFLGFVFMLLSLVYLIMVLLLKLIKTVVNSGF